jgi:hypothetical protein
MAAYWQQIVGDKAQPRHNIHVLDNSVISKLSKLDRVARELDPTPSVSEPQRVAVPVAQQHLPYRSSLFSPVLSMFMEGNNVLVIPESVLREAYHGMRNPFIGNAGDGWVWDYNPDKNPRTPEKSDFTTQKAEMLSRVIHQAFQRDQVSVCDSPKDFVAQFSTFQPDKHVVIVRDSAACGDSAIREIATAIKPNKFGAVSVLCADRDLRKSMMHTLQSYTAADVITLMDAFAKYNERNPTHKDRLSTREAVNDLFARAAEKYEDFEGVQIHPHIDASSNELLEALDTGSHKGQRRQ